MKSNSGAALGHPALINAYEHTLFVVNEMLIDYLLLCTTYFINNFRELFHSVYLQERRNTKPSSEPWWPERWQQRNGEFPASWC